MKLRTFWVYSTMSKNTKTIEIAKKSAQSDWWKQDWVTATPDTKNIQLTISNKKAMVVGVISPETIAQLRWAGYTVLMFENDEYGSSGSLAIPLTPTLKWEGIQRILTNNKYDVTVKS